MIVNIQDAMQYCLEQSAVVGIQKMQCVAQCDETEVLSVVEREMSRLSVTTSATLHLTGIFEQKQADLSVSNFEAASLEQAVRDLLAFAKASKSDPVHAIADYQPPQEIERGAEIAERDLMYARLAEFIEYCRATYPSCVQHETHLAFTRSHTYARNSNNVNLAAHQGVYRFKSFFSAQNNEGASISNTAAFSSAHLDQELQAFGAVDRQLRQTIEQLAAVPLAENFTGDVIFSPESVGAFIALFADQLRDQAFISGVSPFRHRLSEAIASQKFTLHSHPFAEEIAESELITPDGYVAQNSTIIGSGTLNSLLLSQYGARRLQQRRALNQGGAYVIDAGGTPLDTMVASTRKGVFVGGLALTQASGNGDFYGDAQICVFIKEGTMQKPIQSVVIAGNLAEAFQEIRFVSRERANFGNAILPWMQMRNMTIVGK